MGVAEPLENEAINIGELLAQSLAVAVTPWPRAPEAPESLPVVRNCLIIHLLDLPR